MEQPNRITDVDHVVANASYRHSFSDGTTYAIYVDRWINIKDPVTGEVEKRPLNTRWVRVSERGYKIRKALKRSEQHKKNKLTAQQ